MATAMRMGDTIRQYKEAVGRTVQRMESYEERGELGLVGTTLVIQFIDGTTLRFCVSAHTELAAELLPVRKKPQRLPERNGHRSRAATA